MKFYLILIFLFTFFVSSAKVEFFSFNFFNFYRKPLNFNFFINSNSDRLDLQHSHNSLDNKRNVIINFVQGNFYFYMHDSSFDPQPFLKNDSAKGITKPFGGNLTFDTPRIGIHGKGDVYLMMFRLNPDSSRNYGWLKFNISADCDSLYFISSGFNTIINDPVVAGEGEWALSNERFSENFKLFPNPSKSFKLELPKNYFNEKINLEIVDINGKVVHKCPYQNNPYSLTLKPGMYWVIIKNENEILAKIKWMKE